MKIIFHTPFILIILFCWTVQAQFNPQHNSHSISPDYQSAPSSISTDDFLERIGEWPYGSSLSVAVDSLRDIIFLGSGGAVLILDGGDKTNPQLITDTIRTTGLVEDIFYEPSAERLYLACGEGGFEIWDVQFPDQPVLMSRTEIIYYLYEVPVNHVQVKDNYAYLECEWGFVRSVDISNPYNPFQVDADSEMGNPSYDIHIGAEGRLHTTGQQNYVIYNIPPDGSLDGIAEIHFTYGCHAVFGTEDVAYVGTAEYLYIIDIAITGLPFSSPQIDDVIHMEVRGNYLYLINNEGFSIWDVTDKTTPFLTGSISIPYVAEDFYLAGTLAYISVGADGLDVVDITNPYSPVIVGSFDTYSAAVTSVVKDDVAYVTYSGDGLFMIDISNLEYPELIGQFENSSYTYDLKLRDNLVYLTCWEDGFKIIDVSDPTSPLLVSVLSGFNAWMVEIYGNYAYVEEINPPNTTGTIRIINIADPSNPFEISNISIPSYGYQLVYHNGYLFVACYDSGLRILDVSDPQNPFEATSLSLPKVQDVFIRDNDAFVCASDWPTNSGGFYDLDISNPEVPIVKGYYGTAGFFPNDVSVADTFAYVSDGDDIWLFLLTDSDPVYIDQYRFPDLISSMFSAYKYIYISDSKAGLSIYKNNLIENPPITNWQVQTSGITEDIWAVDFTSITEGWAAADQGILLHTTNSGDDWQVVPVGGYFDDFRAITFVNENTGWVCGDNSTMYKTTNGGQNWFALSVPTTSVIRAMCFLNESLGWVVTLEDHLILKTTDGGGTWTQQNSGLSGNLHHVGVWFTDENNGFVIGFVLASPNFENYILRTTDGGQNWTSNFNYQYNDFSSIYFANQNVGWIGGLNGFLINTIDAGNTWQIQNSSTNELITCFSFTDENNGWYSGFNGTLFQTSDGGNSWFQQEVLIEDHLRSVYFPDEGDGWAVGSNGIILHYHDSVTGTENEGIQAPDNFELSQNYPNPFNPSTTIQYSIPEGGNVSLKIFNTLGEEATNLVNEYQQPGIYKVNFNGENLSSGIYFYRLAAGNFIQTKKMILMK